MQLTKWTTIDGPNVVRLTRGVMLRAQDLTSRQIFPIHTHEWNQLVYAIKGSLMVTVGDSWHVITPEQAVWIPVGAAHTTGAIADAEFRTVYFATETTPFMPTSGTVFSVPPLLRALILEKCDLSASGEATPYHDKLDDLILAHLRRLSAQDICLPWPSSRPLQEVCTSLYVDPADSRGIEDWATDLGASSRTLSRWFDREIGMSLREWKHRLRLLLALERLGTTSSITAIALDLGYATPAAFAHMFRTEMGETPTEWRAKRLRLHS